MVTPPSAAARTVPSVIKYLGSKRLLAPLIGDAAQALEARAAADLFAGTTRVGQELRRRGITVLSSDTAAYSEDFGIAYLEEGDRRRLAELLGRCAPLPHAGATSPARSARRPATSTRTTGCRSTARGRRSTSSTSTGRSAGCC